MTLTHAIVSSAAQLILLSYIIPNANAQFNNGSTTSNRTGLAGGSIAGIAVAIVALIVLLFVCACVARVFRRRRLQGGVGAGYGPGYNNAGYGPGIGAAGANVGPSGGYGWGGRGLFGGGFFNRGGAGNGMAGGGYPTTGNYGNAPGVTQPPPAYGGFGPKSEAGYGYGNTV